MKLCNQLIIDNWQSAVFHIVNIALFILEGGESGGSGENSGSGGSKKLLLIKKLLLLLHNHLKRI